MALKLPPLVRAYIRIHTYTYMRMRMYVHARACMHAGLARTVGARDVNPLVERARVCGHWFRWHSSQPSFKGGQHARTLRFL